MRQVVEPGEKEKGGGGEKRESPPTAKMEDMGVVE